MNSLFVNSVFVNSFLRVIRVRWDFNSLFCLLLGFLLPVVPEAAVVLLCVCGGLAYFFSANRQLRTLEVASLLFAIVQAWLVVRAGQPFFMALVTGFVIFLLALSSRVPFRRASLFWGGSIGLFFVLCVAVWDAFGFRPTQPDRWLIQPELVAAEFGEVSRFRPVDPQNAWFVADFGLQGSGEVEYVLELKSDRPLNISVSLIPASGGASNMSRLDKICTVSTTWEKCSIRMDLKKRTPLIAAIGGYGTWKAQGPVLALRSKEFRILGAAPLLERALTFSRVTGGFFNENVRVC